jgi:hypothetical protein
MKTVISWIIAIVLGFILINIVWWILGHAIKLIFEFIVIILGLIIAVPIFLFIKKKIFPDKKY